MKTMRLKDGDLCLCAEGNIEFMDGLQATMQTCENYARAALGEMVTQTDQGMPFFQSAFGRQPDVQLFEAWFRRRMAKVEGVVAVREFDAVIRDDELIYSAVIETVYGEGRLNSGWL